MCNKFKRRGKPLYLKKIQIDIDYILFRIENSRTEIQQLSYVRRNSLSQDLFNDPESVAAQTAQEAILLDMLQQKGKAMIDDLEKKGQDETCIITYDGYLVNGNRRTAALKSIGVRYIECVVLKEDATPKDIYFLEQQLQISEDFKEPYHWINELKNIRHGLEDTRYNFKPEELATNLNLDPKDLKVKIHMLDLIDAFLLWKGVPNQYDYPAINDAEEIFRQLEKGEKKFKDIHKRESLRNAVFTLIESKPKQGRLYKYVTDLIKNFDQVFEKSQGKQPNEVTDEDTFAEGDNSLLSGLTDEKANTQTIFEDSANSTSVSSQIVETLKDIAAANKEQQDAEAVYESVSMALRELQGLVIENDTAKLHSIKSKLEELGLVIERLLSEISATTS